MKIAINGENHTLTESTSLKQLVSGLGFENKRLAVEVNQDIVPRGEYADFLLKDGDKVEIVQAIGGG
jgi:sulfur carrier protein